MIKSSTLIYIDRRASRNGDVSYNALTTDEFNGEDILIAEQPDVCDTIASDLKLSPSTVRRGIRDLKKAGLLETEQRYRKKGGKSSLLFRLKKE